MLVPLPPLSLLFWRHHAVNKATVVAWGAVTQGLAVLAEVPWVNERHHILVPGLGPCALIGRAGPGREEAIGRGAPDSEADSNSSPVVAVLLHLAVVDAAMRQLGSANQDTPLDDHQLVT